MIEKEKSYLSIFSSIPIATPLQKEPVTDATDVAARAVQNVPLSILTPAKFVAIVVTATNPIT